MLVNYSYRKILDSEAFSESYKEFEILWFNPREYHKFIRKKKLLNDDITGFNYNNEVFENNIFILEKTAIYKFAQENKNNLIFIKNILMIL